MAVVRLEQWLARLDEAREGEPIQAVPLCVEVLAKAPGPAVARAAGLLAHLDGSALGAVALDAFSRLGEEGVKLDPGCMGRLALVEALLEVEWPQHEPWWTGLHTVQWEAVWGGRVDTAAGLRGRCALGVVRVGDPRASLALARLLADGEPEARRGAVRALREAPEAWALPLLAHRATAQVEDMDLQLDLYLGLLEREDALAFDLVADALDSKREDSREAAAIALGERGGVRGAALLWATLEEGFRAEERRAAWIGLALSRSAEGREALFRFLENAPSTTRREAAEALEGLRDQELDALLRR